MKARERELREFFRAKYPDVPGWLLDQFVSAAEDGKRLGERPGPRGVITIPEDAWDVYRNDAGVPTYLTAWIEINGTAIHLNAWAVEDRCMDRCGKPLEECRHIEQHALEDDDDFTSIYAGVGMDGSFDTTTIFGREYVLVATPFSQ